MPRTKDRGVVIVTGASTGIGRATALHLDELGFHVFAGVRKAADARKLRTAGSDRLRTVTLDVTKERSISRAGATVKRAAGRSGMAGLVNNAGVGVGGPLEFLSLEKLRGQLEVNLIGQLAVTQEFLPMLRERKGRIVNVTSVGGRIAFPFQAPYHASKWGLEALTHSLRRELRPWGIHVCAVEPGNIATEIWRKADEHATEIRESLPPAAHKLYGQAIEAAEQTIADSARMGIPPERVAKVIARALTERRPKARYVVGMDARALLAINRLGDRTFDRVVAAGMRRSRRRASGR